MAGTGVDAPPPRAPSLDGVRAIAALSVVVFHVWLYRIERPRGERTELLDQVLFRASSGLIFFFVLSGFLLYGAFARAALTGADGVALVPYLRRRAARIVPAYWLCGVGCLALFAAVDHHAITPSAGELPVFALFLQNYSPTTMMRLNPVTWTLCVEVAFYALLPLVGRLALRSAPGRPRAQAVLAPAPVPGAPRPQVLLVLALVAVTPTWALVGLAAGWDRVLDQALPAYLASFGVGVLVAIWVQSLRLDGRAPLGRRATTALVVTALVVVVLDAAWTENGWWLREGVFSARWLRPTVQ